MRSQRRQIYANQENAVQANLNVSFCAGFSTVDRDPQLVKND